MKQLALLGLILGLIVGFAVTSDAYTFYDNFNDGNANGWELLPGARGLPALWSVQSGMLVQGGTDDFITALVKNLVVPGQSIEVQVQTSGYAGVVLWYQDSGNYLSVGINPFSAGVYISEVVDGQQLSPYWRYEYGTRSGDIYDLRVDADSANGHLAIYLNDAHVFTYDSSTPNRTGLSGVLGGNNLGYFDNFRVTYEASAPVPEPSTLLIVASGFATWGAMAWRRRHRG